MTKISELTAATSVADADYVPTSPPGSPISYKATRSQFLSGYMQSANNLTDVADAPTALANLGAGDIATYNIGTGFTTAGGAISVDTSSNFAFTRDFAIAAAGTTQGTATLLSHVANVCTTVASGTGVRLGTSGPVWLRNAGANALSVYPPSGGKINALSTNAAATLAVGGSVMLDTSDGSQWYTF